ncbi:ankyrin repeat-containing protein At5g02620-like [Phaseolus vulgaris]|uniref:ankyrin repeat-containing protein At5g02620-like n=1 Tax=Phaseolus vulgaris TaxID=3885 RepID=UPI0035CB4A0C
MNSAAKEEEKVSAFLTAARNGIEEIVLGLQSKVPSVVHETSPRNENVLLVAVKNKQVSVTDLLRKNLKKEIFDSLILEMDDIENTVLHLAAGTSINKRTSNTMQMIRDIKWYEYISGLVPEEFNYRRNKYKHTAWEIYERKHMQKVKDSSDALKDLSNSASVVAALIAGVSFATSGSLPGSTEDGKPIYSDQPAFDVFSMAALFGLGFSITALVMFLAILTSSKQAQDFRFSLPLKLIFRLGSLFASVASMLVSFWAAYFFVLNEKYKRIIFPVCAATCLPLTIYAVMQFPFYVELLRVISSKTPLPYRTHHPFIGPTFSR